MSEFLSVAFSLPVVVFFVGRLALLDAFLHALLVVIALVNFDFTFLVIVIDVVHAPLSVGVCKKSMCPQVLL